MCLTFCPLSGVLLFIITISLSDGKAIWRNYNQCILVFYEQRDTSGLNAENNELKLRVQSMEQQVHLQDGKLMLL